MSRFYQNVLTGKQVEVTTLEDDDFYVENSANWCRIAAPQPQKRKKAAEPEKGPAEFIDLRKLDQDELILYAEAHGIDLGDARKKRDILEAIASAPLEPIDDPHAQQMTAEDAASLEQTEGSEDE
jgi:hypothetical protein